MIDDCRNSTSPPRCPHCRRPYNRDSAIEQQEHVRSSGECGGVGVAGSDARTLCHVHAEDTISESGATVGIKQKSVTVSVQVGIVFMILYATVWYLTILTWPSTSRSMCSAPGSVVL